LSCSRAFVLTVGIDADRTQRLYGGSITPDVLVNNADEAVVDAAVSWLTTSTANGRIR
jgi:hypothetical protein